MCSRHLGPWLRLAGRPAGRSLPFEERANRRRGGQRWASRSAEYERRGDPEATAAPAELVGRIGSEVLGAQNDHLRDAMRSQPSLSILPIHPAQRSLEAFDALAERTQDGPDDKRLDMRMRRDDDHDHGRFALGGRVDCSGRSEIVVAVDDDLNPEVS
jgi:hypothetical protein